MKIGLVFSWINYRCLKVDPQTARFLKVAVLALIRRLNKDLPVNTLLYQSKTFALDRSCCIFCRNEVHSIQFGMLNKETNLFINNQYLFCRSINLKTSFKIHVFQFWKHSQTYILFFYFVHLMSKTYSCFLLFFRRVLFEMYKWKLGLYRKQKFDQILWTYLMVLFVLVNFTI